MGHTLDHPGSDEHSWWKTVTMEYNNEKRVSEKYIVFTICLCMNMIQFATNYLQIRKWKPTGSQVNLQKEKQYGEYWITYFIYNSHFKLSIAYILCFLDLSKRRIEIDIWFLALSGSRTLSGKDIVYLKRAKNAMNGLKYASKTTQSIKHTACQIP